MVVGLDLFSCTSDFLLRWNKNNIFLQNPFSVQMARAIDFIKDINDEKELWKLIVCLEDVWKTGIGQGEHLEFLILDKQVKFSKSIADLYYTLLKFTFWNITIC
jgi:hypothetical protein